MIGWRLAGLVAIGIAVCTPRPANAADGQTSATSTSVKKPAKARMEDYVSRALAGSTEPATSSAPPGSVPPPNDLTRAGMVRWIENADRLGLDEAVVYDSIRQWVLTGKRPPSAESIALEKARSDLERLGVLPPAPPAPPR